MKIDDWRGKDRGGVARVGAVGLEMGIGPKKTHMLGPPSYISIADL